MKIVEPDTALAERFAADIPELVHATGPASYDYHFDQWDLFAKIVTDSWVTPGTLFSADATRLAIDGDELLGIEIGFHGPEFEQRKHALGPLWAAALSSGTTTEAALTGVIEHSALASWLNPVVRPGVFYVHALSVKPEQRARRVGYELLNAAIDRAADQGYERLQLDVLTGNPAIDFYQSMGLELLVESSAPKPQAAGVPPEWRMGRELILPT